MIAEGVRRLPAPPLRELVASYAGYRQHGMPPGRHRGLPSPYLTLIITFDEPLVIAKHPDRRQSPGRYGTLLGGLHTSPALITHDGRQSGIQLALHPLRTRALLGLPAGELAGTDVDAGDVLGPIATELQARVQQATTWPQRFAAVDDVLLRHASGAAPPRPDVARAWQRLLTSGGRATVRELAAEVGCSERHLGLRFRTEIGLSPKAAARVARFDRARTLLQRDTLAGSARPLADLAASCGYYDQAHLARDFREFAGCPPTQWLAEEFGEFGNFQVSPDLATATSSI